MRIAAGHERGTRGRAHRLRVELLEPGALLGELVDVRRLDVGAVEADVLPSLIVRDDVDNVGPRSRGLGGGRCDPADRDRQGKGNAEPYGLHVGVLPIGMKASTLPVTGVRARFAADCASVTNTRRAPRLAPCRVSAGGRGPARRSRRLIAA